MTFSNPSHQPSSSDSNGTRPDDSGTSRRLLQSCIRPLQRAFFRPRSVRPHLTEPAEALEAAVRARTDELERTVAALRLELEQRKVAEQELTRARDAAETADRAKTAGLANLSHEIRSLANGVMGVSNLLLGTPLNPEQADLAQIVYRTGERLLSIINDMLDFSKIETGSLKLAKIDFDLAEAIRAATEFHAEAAARKSLDLVVDIDPGVPSRVCGDPQRLRQVILNLMSNALKFTEHGGIALSVRCEEKLPGSTRLRFCVTDTGVGIAPAAQVTLFQPFAAGDAALLRRGGGSGIGLAISKHLVGLMGGEMGVISSVGAGSTFWFSVVLEHPHEVGLAGPAADGCLTGRHVLIVDDNSANRRLFGDLAAAWGMFPGTAESADAALAYLREAHRRGQPFEVVVLDHDIAGRDGLELARTILCDPTVPHPQIVLLSGSDAMPRKPELEAHGIAACEMKPIHPKKLRAAIARVLGSPVKRDK